MRRFDPCGAIGREPAGGDEEMRVRMVLHGARPGVEHREDAERPADLGAIGGEGLGCRRRFAEEEGVDRVLMRSREGAEFAREREGE